MKQTLALVAVLLSISTMSAQSNQRNCGTMAHKAYEEKKFPEIIQRRADFENQIKKQNEWRSSKRENGTVVIIPTVIHVLYNNANTNISESQIQSQMDILNADFRKTNYNVGSILSDFQSIAADCEVQFCLASKDPLGNPTTGITRTSTSKSSYDSDLGEMKKSSTGGVDAWDRDKYLNIWVTPALDGGVLGFAQFPGGQAATDGVVIAQEYFGNIGTATSPPFNKGRTATHEVGHWLGLYHIWGDSNCGNDQIDDTPTQQESSSGCPLTSKTCDNKLDNVQNYMDYSNDDCMAMFTQGQAQRVWDVLNTSRSSLKTSANTNCANDNPPVANFDADVQKVCAGSTVQFTDQSSGNPNGWSWTFENGVPGTSTIQNPIVVFSEGGSFDVSLVASNVNGPSDVKISTDFIEVTKVDTAELTLDNNCDGSVTMVAVSSLPDAQIEWYSDISLQNQLNVGASYTVSPSQNTKYYAVVNSSGSEQYVGNPSTGTGGYHAGNQGLNFNVSEAFTLQTVEVDAETAGTSVIEYTDPSGSKITKTVYVVSGKNTITLDIDIVVGDGHLLYLPSGNVLLHRDNAGVNYPYALGNYGSVINSTATGVNLDYYYYFYNWKIKRNGCLSAAAEILAKPDNCVSVNSLDAGIKVYPNPSSGFVIIENTQGLEGDVLVFDVRGALLSKQKLSIENSTISGLSTGTYIVEISTRQNVYQQKIIVK